MEQTKGHNEEEVKKAYRVSYLVAGYIRKTLTIEEQEELDDWINTSDANMRLFGELTNEDNIGTSLASFEKIKVEKDLRKVKEKIASKKSKVARFHPMAFAASFILLAGLSIFLYKYLNKGTESKSEIIVSTDLLPGKDQATLIMNDGKVIALGSEADTNINNQIKVIGKEGELVYATDTTITQEIYHTLNVPRKGQYKLILPDGSKVWLNAESSIKFPIAFNGDERKVFVTGETYFEVAKNKEKPFRVVANGLTVEAVGTAFNVNAYPNENVIRSTLVEGKVKVAADNKVQMLEPGQEVVWDNKVLTVATVDANESIAWKNDEFKFHNTSLAVIMRQIERWYDVDVILNSTVDVHLNATIERNVPLSKILHYLEEAGGVKFNVDGNKITVQR